MSSYLAVDKLRITLTYFFMEDYGQGVNFLMTDLGLINFIYHEIPERLKFFGA